MPKSTMNRRDFTLFLAAGGSASVLLTGLAGCGKKEAAPAAPGPTGAPVNPVAGIDYRVLKKPVATEAPKGKAELIEFFGYWCPHCNTLAPTMETWRKQAPAEILFSMVPVSFGDPAREPLQRMYFALRDIGKLDAMHLKVFDALHKEKQPLFTQQAILDWAGKQPELAGSGFAQAYNSFSMDAQISRANQMTDAYEVDGVPSFGVAGKYYCDGVMAKSLDRALQIATLLAQKEAKGQA